MVGTRHAAPERRARALDFLYEDDFGRYIGEPIKLNLYLSRLEWERGCRDEAFESLEKARRLAVRLSES